VPRPVVARQSSWLRWEIDVAGGPVFVSPPWFRLATSDLPVIMLAVTPASITLAGRSDHWKPLQQLPSAGSSRP
jgi:uncharacterized membrane protein